MILPGPARSVLAIIFTIRQPFATIAEQVDDP